MVCTKLHNFRRFSDTKLLKLAEAHMDPGDNISYAIVSVHSFCYFYILNFTKENLLKERGEYSLEDKISP